MGLFGNRLTPFGALAMPWMHSADVSVSKRLPTVSSCDSAGYHVSFLQGRLGGDRPL